MHTDLDLPLSVGENCLSGAGALATMGKEFWDNSLSFGSPAKVVYQFGDTALKGQPDSIKKYMTNAKGFEAGWTAD